MKEPEANSGEAPISQPSRSQERTADPSVDASGKTAASPSVNQAPEKRSEPTAEEQMARFEEEMKNEDWGHQPC